MRIALLPLTGLLLTSAAASAQSFALTGLLPARHATAAPRAANVGATFSQPLGAASTGAIRVFSSQRGGRLAGTATVSGNTLSFDPAREFKPGELVQATITTTAQSSGGTALTKSQTLQFTAAATGGTGVFGGGSEVVTGAGPVGVAAADVDGDGDLDLLTANASSDNVSIRLNTGNGTFSGGSEVAVGGAPLSVVAADVDGDGDLDMLAANTTGASVSVRLNTGDGTFVVPPVAANGTVGVGSSPQMIKTADVDGDGDLDILAVNYIFTPNSSVTVRLNNGAGVFSGGSVVSVGRGALALAAGDVDNDGDLDLLTANFSPGTVSVRLNNGQGQFTGSLDLAVGSYAQHVVAADMDNDGDLDLLVVDNSLNSIVTVCLNDGQGNFSVTPGIVVGSTPLTVVPADVDGDGDLDIVVSCSNSSGVSVRLNNGAAQFSGTTLAAVGGSPSGLAVADLDNDGDLDFLTAVRIFGNPGEGQVSIRLNNATGPALAAARPARAPLLALYPNPAHHEARLQVPAGTREVAVRNALGQRLRVVAVAAHDTEVLLPLDSLPAGVYTVQAGAATGRLVVQ